MSRRKLSLFALPLVAAAAALVAGCSHSSTTHWSQATWQTTPDPDQTPYVYYQTDQVLYEPYGRTYFYLAGEKWCKGSTLPKGRTLSQDKPVVVYMPYDPTFLTARPGGGQAQTFASRRAITIDDHFKPYATTACSSPNQFQGTATVRSTQTFGAQRQLTFDRNRRTPRSSRTVRSFANAVSAHPED